MRWQQNQKQAVLKHFKRHVKNSIPPKKNECVEFVKKTQFICRIGLGSHKNFRIQCVSKQVNTGTVQ